MKLNRTRNRLKKAGYLLREWRTTSGRSHEEWVDSTGVGTPISYYYEGDEVDGALKIHGRLPDVIQADLWYSTFSRNLSQAIRLSRVK